MCHAIQLRFGYGFESCGPWNVKNPNPEKQGPFFPPPPPPLLSVGTIRTEMFTCIFFVFAPNINLITVAVTVFILLEFNFWKITGGSVCMGSRQTFAFPSFFYFVKNAHRNPQDKQLVWKVVCATSTNACVQPCRPRLTKSLDKIKETGGLPGALFSTKTYSPPCLEVIFGKTFPRSSRIGLGMFWRESIFSPCLGYFTGGPPKKNGFFAPPPTISIKKCYYFCRTGPSST